MRTSPSRQLDPGLYTVINRMPDGAEVEVGKVFVEGDDSLSIEHYVLSGAHRSPTGLREFVITKHEPFDGSLAEFFASMRESMAGQPIAYIKARCEYSDSIPEL